MTHITRNDIARNYLDMLQEKTTKDICWFYHLKQKGISFFNRDELHEQMKAWRTLAVDGKIKIINYNNRKRTTFDGKEWYILVVQPENYTTPDPIGIMLMSYMVSGMVYCFKEKKNRDDVAKWVMRKLDAGEKMEFCCLCDEEIEGIGNIPDPIREDGRCCDKCNAEKVLPARFLQMR
jgi:hypothetical protein